MASPPGPAPVPGLGHGPQSPLLHPPGTLRKSLSVDSFVALSKQAAAGKTRSSGGHEDTSDEEDDYGVGQEEWYGVADSGDITFSSRGPAGAPGANGGSSTLGLPLPPLRGRRRAGTGMSLARDDSDLDPYLDDDSDHERIERATDLGRLRAASNASRMTASTSTSAAGASTVSLGAGVGNNYSNAGVPLPLPARKNSRQRDSSQPPPPVPPIPREVNRPGPITLPPSQPPAAISIDVPLRPTGQHEFVIAVVGAGECGKSTLISIGTHSWRLVEAPLGLTIGPAGSGGRIEIISRATTPGVPSPSHGNTTLQVLEVDSALLETPTLGAWPVGMPAVDGVLVCYDSSNAESFALVPSLLRGYHALGLSTVLLACKSEVSPKMVTPQRASEYTSRYKIGLVEVSSETDGGRRKMKDSFNWLIKAIGRARRDPTVHALRNPASPDLLRSSQPHPWALPPSGDRRSSRDLPSSPTRARSTNDLLAEARRVREGAVRSPRASADETARQALAITAEPDRDRDRVSERNDEPPEERPLEAVAEETREESKDPVSIPFLTLDELLDKLLFFAVSGDDSTFIQHFFLTFRRFASPRRVLLGMQKRLRALSTAPSGVLLAKFAQMKICAVLEYWIQNYDSDFATLGAESALRALLKQLVAHIHTAHYGSDLLPFLDAVSELVDRENAWYAPIEDAPPGLEDEDEAYDADQGLIDDGKSATTIYVKEPVEPSTPGLGNGNLAAGPPSAGPPRERASSFPLQSVAAAVASAQQITSTPSLASSTNGSLRPPPSILGSSSPAFIGERPGVRASLKELQRIGQLFQLYEATHVAEEITRYMLSMFMKIEPRQWLHHVATTKRDPKTDPIREFNQFYNYLSLWVASLILAPDKAAKRVKQIERFVDLAKALRVVHNYSGLRCVLNGINMAKIDGDEVSELFRTRSRALHKVFMSYTTLLGSSKMHRAYRTALKHTDGPAIPDMEIHTSDLRRAHDSNIDFKEGDRTKIHWGKFALMGRLVNNVTMFQNRCRASLELNFPERPQLHHQLFSPSTVLMDSAMIDERVGEPPPLTDTWDGTIPMTSQMDLASSTATHDASSNKPTLRSRRLFFW